MPRTLRATLGMLHAVRRRVVCRTAEEIDPCPNVVYFLLLLLLLLLLLGAAVAVVLRLPRVLFFARSALPHAFVCASAPLRAAAPPQQASTLPSQLFAARAP